MKSKKLVVMLSILAFLTVLIVLNSTLFTLQTVNVNWLTTKYELSGLKDDDITNNVLKGESIFLLNKQNIADKLEKEYPYLRVVSIETKFPNKIVIHSAEREGMFAVDLGAGEFAIIDGLGKVLRFATDNIFVGNDLGTKPIRLIFNEGSLNHDNFVVGEAVKHDKIVTIVNQLSTTLAEAGHSPTTSKGVFTSINVEFAGERCKINMNTRNGMKICINNAEEYTTEKFLLALERYNYWQQEGVVSGTINAWYNERHDKIYAAHDALDVEM